MCLQPLSEAALSPLTSQETYPAGFGRQAGKWKHSEKSKHLGGFFALPKARK